MLSRDCPGAESEAASAASSSPPPQGGRPRCLPSSPCVSPAILVSGLLSMIPIVSRLPASPRSVLAPGGLRELCARGFSVLCAGYLLTAISCHDLCPERSTWIPFSKDISSRVRQVPGSQPLWAGLLPALPAWPAVSPDCSRPLHPARNPGAFCSLSMATRSPNCCPALPSLPGPSASSGLPPWLSHQNVTSLKCSPAPPISV